MSPVDQEEESATSDRLVQAFWWGLKPSVYGTGWFGVWASDPAVNILNAIDKVQFPGDENGQVVFSAKFNSSSLPDDVSKITKSKCLPYWVGFVMNDLLLYSDCLKIHPQWMGQLKNKHDCLSKARMTDFVLPGTHDAGASLLYKDLYKYNVHDILTRFTFTHHDGIYEQLVMGVRYLDIRIGYYPTRQHKYYLNHSFVSILPLYICLEDVAKFMSQTRDEIVIFDIHELEDSFDNHSEALPGLLTLLESYFHPWMLPNSFQSNSTLGSIWDTKNKRLIVTFPGNPPSEHYWKNVHHLWANTDDLDDLLKYMDSEIPRFSGSNFLWSVMGQFTANYMDIITDNWGGLMGAANITNFPVTTKLRNYWWAHVNIVSMDFIAASAVIDTVIKANELKFNCVS